MRNRIILGALAAFGLTGTALAKDVFDYNYLEGGYVHTTLDTLPIKVSGNGLGIGGSYALTDQFLAFASYTDQNFDFSVKLKGFELGAGMRWDLTPTLDLIGTVFYLDSKADVPGFRSINDSGLGLGASVRAWVAPQLELDGGLKHENFDKAGGQTSLLAGARYYFTPQFAAGADVGFSSDITTFRLGARYVFTP